jgi:hypothetical protein
MSDSEALQYLYDETGNELKRQFIRPSIMAENLKLMNAERKRNLIQYSAKMEK